MYGAEGTSNLYFATHAKQLSEGLLGQLEAFIHEHQDTKLIIIDPLQMVRDDDTRRHNYSYNADYKFMEHFKKITMGNDLCLLLVHHSRKQKSDDSFDRLSGTNGLFGASDGAFFLDKELDTNLHTTLKVSGRNHPELECRIARDKKNLTWKLISE
jgi:RecA-family ATPase